MMYEICQVIEYYQLFFNSEDDDICSKNDAACAEYSRDKSYLSDEDYKNYLNSGFYLCSENPNICE